MDFSYIKSAASCSPACKSAGGIGPPEGDPGLPQIEGNPGTPNIPGTPTAPGNPSVVGDGPLGDPSGQEITCVKVELFPAEATIKINQLLPFIVKVTYSNGKVGYPHRNNVFSSSDDSIATFDDPTEPHFRSGRDPNDPLIAEGILNDPLAIDWGYYIRGVAAGEVTVTAQYDAPSTKSPTSVNPSANWYGACNATLTAAVTVTDEVVEPCIQSTEAYHRWNPGDIQSLTLSFPYDQDLLLIIGHDPIKIQATFLLTNGDSAFLDTIHGVVWSSSDESIATVDCNGFVTGLTVGTVTITATAEGFADTIDIDIVAPATEASIHGNTYTARPIDVVVVLDRSSSMLLRDREGVTRVERARKAAKMMLANLTDDESQVALVTFAGIRIPGETISDPVITEADAVLELTLTTDRREIREALNYFKVVEPTTILSGNGTRGATGIGAALVAARAEINSDRHQYGNKKMILLLADGAEDVNDPAPTAVSDEIKTEGTLISIVALNVDSDTAEDLEALATPGLYFPSPTAYELSLQFAQAPYYVQYREYGYNWYE